MISKIPFYVGNFLSVFFRNTVNRRCCRGMVNVFLYGPCIRRFIKKTYNEKVVSIKFVRQINLNRFCCVVNDRYYVKIFRNVTVERLKDYKFLLDFIRPYISVAIPVLYVHDKIPMYVNEKLPGRNVHEFDFKLVMKNEDKIRCQVIKIISEIQKIKIESIPRAERFIFGIQPERQREKTIAKPHPVLAHFDFHETNLLLDDDFNIISLIDWDTLSIAKNPETDLNVFDLYWKIYKCDMQAKQ